MTRGRPRRYRGDHLRWKIAKRHGHRCFYCRTRFEDAKQVTLDHFVPYSVWRTWCEEALVPACWSCNQAKADSLPLGLVLVVLALARRGAVGAGEAAGGAVGFPWAPHWAGSPGASCADASAVTLVGQ